jgi:hypothetical protein
MLKLFMTLAVSYKSATLIIFASFLMIEMLKKLDSLKPDHFF